MVDVVCLGRKIRLLLRSFSMKKGLVLEGGAMRGMFTCGVLDVFMEHGVTFDGAAGISAGAVFGSNFKSGQIGRGVRYNKKYAKDPRYCSMKSLRETGNLYNVDFCYHELPKKLDPFDCEAFAKNPMEFYVGATDIKTGEPVYHKCTDCGDVDLEWMRASASMPLVSTPVKVDGYELLDGGIVDAIPLNFLESKGYDRNVIILTQPRGYRKKKTGFFLLWALRKTPIIGEKMKVRHEMYNQELDEIEMREVAGDVFVIRPPESLGISRTESNPEELERVYQIGRSVAEKNLDAMLAFLDKK